MSAEEKGRAKPYKKSISSYIINKKIVGPDLVDISSEIISFLEKTSQNDL